MDEYIILVDDNDTECGIIEKMAAHRLGLLHRAFSVFIFNKKGELLLQQRADSKYHSPGCWSNTCCSHPRRGETVAEAVKRRLNEEMGLSCSTKFLYSFIYNEKLSNGLIEHEYDHVYLGISDDLPAPEKTEVKSWKYMGATELCEDINRGPEKYTIWFKHCIQDVLALAADNNHTTINN